MTRKYIHESFGELFEEYIGKKPGASLEAALKLSRALPFSDSSCYSIILNLSRGNVLEDGYNNRSSILSPNDFALRFSHYLDILGVPKSHRLISEGRRIFKTDFEYPPTQDFPSTTGQKRKVYEVTSPAKD